MIKPLYDKQQNLVGYSLPTIKQIEERNQRKLKADKMTALLHAISDPHYKGENPEIHRYGQVISRNVWENRLPLVVKPIKSQVEISSEPKYKTPIVNQESQDKLKITLDEPHIWGRSKLKSKPNLRDLERKLFVADLTDALISDIENEKRKKEKTHPIQVPLYDSVEVPEVYVPEDNSNLPQRRVIVTDIDGGDGLKHGVYEVKYD